ncbi:MAG: tRNA (N6-threonylcarbamoyladenosine(37)-N6)-methyltransferase TrmO [Theionarchaea archaeon]|nr:tRNA (N6-threonylcarbamoyladenosine(37)-N6)-methyltransferase TrmO [Theionarchaea archaeon]MBU7041157.1 tRNA (N6-threonylcarbamoyladenosine(37)-N6)-methyltransferase TrmO [Theionarchaea archaeon]
MSICLVPIGVVKNGITERPPAWKDVISEIHIRKELQEGLSDLEEFSHVLVLFYLHLSMSSRLKVHPRGDESLPLVGVFGTRAPVRPNPIGVTITELVSVRENILTVKGLDAFDETPVLDIKPHLPMPEPVRLPQWVSKTR